jgi:hypothetical protein
MRRNYSAAKPDFGCEGDDTDEWTQIPQGVRNLKGEGGEGAEEEAGCTGRGRGGG